MLASLFGIPPMPDFPRWGISHELIWQSGVGAGMGQVALPCLIFGLLAGVLCGVLGTVLLLWLPKRLGGKS